MKKIETTNNKVKKQQTYESLVITFNHEMWKAKKAKTHNRNSKKGRTLKSIFFLIHFIDYNNVMPLD